MCRALCLVPVSRSSQGPALMGPAVGGGDRQPSSHHHTDQMENCAELQGFEEEVCGSKGPALVTEVRVSSLRKT